LPIFALNAAKHRSDPRWFDTNRLSATG